MTQSATEATPRATSNDGAPDIHHYVCCDKNLALCGTDVTEVPFTSGAGEQECTVCYDLHGSSEWICPVCGE